MSLPVRVTAEAARDLEEARNWYQREAPGLERQFEEEVTRTFQLIGDQPRLYRKIESLARRAVLGRFPYSVYYRTLPEWIEVLAVLHQARHPRTWKRNNR